MFSLLNLLLNKFGLLNLYHQYSRVLQPSQY
nr:MAG TPA: hypothetical protein [Caudoviricetes sp.]